MGRNWVITVVVAVGAFASVTVAAPAQADEASFFRSLENRGVSSAYTPSEALSIGQYLCGGLRAGRDYNSVYSDLVDYAYTQVGKPRGSLGQVLGAAWNNLCPEFTAIGSTVQLEYIPKNQRH